MDSIQEMAVQTSNYAAEFGKAGGGVFLVTMRSGTNQFHGTGYDYFVNEAFNAGTPFTSGSKGLLRPVERRNDYGYTFGGPVWIPKVYDGRNKMFWSMTWNGIRQSKAETTDGELNRTVPTMAMRSGFCVRWTRPA